MKSMVADVSKTLCVRCGGPVQPDRLGGLCVRCVSRVSLGSQRAGLLPAAGAAAPVRLGGYELGAELGRGAMGAVYRARDPGLGRDVALKVILSGQFASEQERRRFLAEAEHAARLDHPGLVPIYQSGETDGRAWFAMKLIEGGTLAEALRAGKFFGGPDRFRTAASLMSRMARAVQHAHERGVLHRDLKPGNVLLDGTGSAHVADFGLARGLGADGSLSAAGSPLGTPAYMSPEAARGAVALTVAADVWSLGAILYELLCGRPPFAGGSVPEMLRAVVEQEPAAPPSDVPRDLATVALHCLKRDPASRYVSAAELADELDRWLRGEPVEARPVGNLGRMILWARRQPLVASLVLALVTSFLLGGLLLVRANRRLSRSLVETRRAELTARTNLHAALLAQVRARRGRGSAPTHADTLAVIREAARIAPTLDTRNEAIVALAARDLASPSPRPVFRELPEAPFALKQACHIDVHPSEPLAVLGTYAGLVFYDVRAGRRVGDLRQAGMPWMTAFFEPDGNGLLYSARNLGIRRAALEIERDGGGAITNVSLGPPQNIGRPIDATLQERQGNGRDWLVALDRNPVYIVRAELWPDGDPSRARTVVQGEPMTWVTASADGRWALSTVFPAMDVRVWDVAGGAALRWLGTTQGLHAAFFPDSRRIISRDRNEFAVWETGSWKKLHAWPSETGGMVSRYRFPSGTGLFSVLQGTDRIEVRRLSDYAEQFTLTPPKPMDLVESVWTPAADRVVTATMSGQVFVWDVEALREALGEFGLAW
jgi:hypothetical protein